MHKDSVIQTRIECPYSEELVLCGMYGKGDELKEFKGFDKRCEGCEKNGNA